MMRFLPDPAMIGYFAIAIAIGQRHFRGELLFMTVFATTTITAWSVPALIEWITLHTTSPLIMNGLLEFLWTYLLALCVCDGPTWKRVGTLGIFTAITVELRRTLQTAVIQPFLIAALPSAIRAWMDLGVIPRRVGIHWYTATFVAFRIVWPAYALTQITTTAAAFSTGLLLIVSQCGLFVWRLIFDPPLIE